MVKRHSQYGNGETPVFSLVGKVGEDSEFCHSLATLFILSKQRNCQVHQQYPFLEEDGRAGVLYHCLNVKEITRGHTCCCWKVPWVSVTQMHLANTSQPQPPLDSSAANCKGKQLDSRSGRTGHQPQRPTFIVRESMFEGFCKPFLFLCTFLGDRLRKISCEIQNAFCIS